MAGTKRSYEAADDKASKKTKVALGGTQKGKKATSTKVENLNHDFVGFDAVAEQTENNHVKSKEGGEKSGPTKHIKPKKPESYLNGKFR